ncbi:MAG: DUF5009 domain-containing protein [Victivallaceae bacterium]|nr:DUF5009 domain-containing protein [Victivallaceae bacterium]
MGNTKVDRVGSVDILRGLVMFAMIFVNCGFYRQPPWCGHYPSGGDGITFVDIIFPAFLFLAGVSIPLAFARYAATFSGKALNFYHVCYRAATLMVMGVIYVNTGFDVTRMGLTAAWWHFISLAIIVLVWHQYKGENRAGRVVSEIVRLLGIAALVGYYFYYASPSNAPEVLGTELRPSWWGILGLIGRAYLIAATIYLAIGRRAELLMFAVLLATLIHVTAFGGGLKEWWWLSGGDRVMITVGQASVTMLGVVAGAKILDFQQLDAAERHRKMTGFLIWFALLAFASGIVLRKLYGLHKDGTFPAYVYTTVGWTTAAWVVIYRLSDVWKINNFVTRFLLGVGSVALSAYVFSSLLRNALTLIPAGDGQTMFQLLFKSLGPLCDAEGLPGLAPFAGAFQTFCYALTVALVCLRLKKHRLTLKI